MNFFIVFTIFALATNALAGLIGTGKGTKGEANLGIVHGQLSAAMKPYLVSVRVNNRQICGGTIVSERLIVTAAHCLQKGIEGKYYSVGVGHTKLEKQKVYKVSTYTYHSKYSQDIDYNNDIAVLTLAEPIAMQVGKVSKVDLSHCKDGNVPPYGETATVAGWGATEEGGYGTQDLYEVKVKVLRNSEDGCSSYRGMGMLSNTMFCAGWPNGYQDSCQGDSGGPLVNRYNQLIGVVSWGLGCAKAHQGGVYTNVCLMYSWIMDNRRSGVTM